MGQHIKNIHTDSEVDVTSTSKKIYGVVENRPNYGITHYNLDVVISVGYKVNSKTATRFRQWATRVLADRIIDTITVSGREYDELRDRNRRRVSRRYLRMNAAAKDMGVKRFGIFNDARYRGLYNMPYGQLRAYKKIGDDNLLDRMGPDELIANEMSMFQSEGRMRGLLKQGRLVGELAAFATVFQVGRDVRANIESIGGEMPEDMPAEPDHIREVRKRLRTSRKPKTIAEGQLPLL